MTTDIRWTRFGARGEANEHGVAIWAPPGADALDLDWGDVVSLHAWLTGVIARRALLDAVEVGGEDCST